MRWARSPTEMAAAGTPLGDIIDDSGYAHRDADAWAIPLRNAGAQLVQDLHPHDRGPKGTHQGAVIANGNLYCPQTPRTLLELAPPPRRRTPPSQCPPPTRRRPALAPPPGRHRPRPRHPPPAAPPPPAPPPPPHPPPGRPPPPRRSRPPPPPPRAAPHQPRRPCRHAAI